MIVETVQAFKVDVIENGKFYTKALFLRRESIIIGEFLKPASLWKCKSYLNHFVGRPSSRLLIFLQKFMKVPR